MLSEENFRFIFNNPYQLFKTEDILGAIEQKYDEDLGDFFNNNEQDPIREYKLQLVKAIGGVSDVLTYSDKLARDILYDDIMGNSDHVYQRNCIFFRDNKKYRDITKAYKEAIKEIIETYQEDHLQQDINLQQDDDFLTLGRNNAYVQQDDNEQFESVDNFLKRGEIIQKFKEKIIKIANPKICLCDCMSKTSVMTK